MLFSLLGSSSGGLTIVTNLLILFLVLVYLALVYWTYLDAKRRIEDPVLIACATAVSLFPFVGTVVYTILRPPEFLEDVRERELEIRASELRVRELVEQSCPYCEYPIERSFVRCPNCERKLKNPCRSCGKALDPKWGVCPYCETEVRKQKPKAPEGGGAPRREHRDRREREARAERERRSEQRAARVAAQQGQRPGSQRSGSQPSQPSRPEQRQHPAGSSGGGEDPRQPAKTAAERIEDRRQGRTQ